jgi:UDP-N-acetylglucosamine 2-epimerase (non-hydrolysing)
MLITLVAGARPNFMKIAPIIKSLQLKQVSNPFIQYRLVHTGQHYDTKMSEEIFSQLGIPQPDRNLNCGGGSQATQTASIMIGFEQELLANKPDVVLVVGDVTSTMACTIVAKKMGIDTVHVEAGIRSGDMSMPEEINRIVTDSICDLFFTTSPLAGQRLLQLNIPEEKIHFVGNTMIDSLYQNLHKLIVPDLYKANGLSPQNFILLTLHRPSNVDNPIRLSTLLDRISDFSKGLPVVFPVHPRTSSIIDKHEIKLPNFIFSGPMSYLEFIFLVQHAKAVITDSGGITEEATVLNVPCLTMRDTTERPETVDSGTNVLIGDDVEKLRFNMEKILANQWKTSQVPELWDGNAAHRIVEILTSKFGNINSIDQAQKI